MSSVSNAESSQNSCPVEVHDNSIASDVLTNVIIVIRKIFKLLNARQLNACSRVCRIWRDQVKWEKGNRKQLRWNYFTYEDNCDSVMWKNTVQSFIEDSPFDPTCILVFCTATLWAQVVEQRTGKKRKKRNTMSPGDLILPSIPSSCVFQLIITDGVIGTDSVHNKTKEMEDYSCAVSLLMLGQFPGVEFSSFSLSHVEWDDLAQYWSSNGAKKPMSLKHLFSKDVKMFNLYCPMSGIDQEVCYALFKLFGWPLISGGFVNERYLRDYKGVFHSTHHACIISGLALCGDVQVASILLRSHIQLEEEVQRVIRGLVDYNFPYEKSFGLMYACVGRGQHLYNKQNVEADIFRKFFPNTPLLGFFGNGEIGCTFPQPGLMPVAKSPKANPKGEEELTAVQLKRHMVEMRAKLDEYRNTHVPKILHSYTTCICLISLP